MTYSDGSRGSIDGQQGLESAWEVQLETSKTNTYQHNLEKIL